MPKPASPPAPTAPAWTAAPTLAAVRAGDAVLQKYQHGDAVGYLQRLLGVHDDNWFGDDTEKAVAAFQQAKGMQIDPGFAGKAGRHTLAALEQRVPVPAVSTVPASAGNFDPDGLLAAVHPELRRRVLAMVVALSNRGIQIRVTGGRRTFPEQDKLYRKGRVLVDGRWVCASKGCAGTVTNAPGGLSNHNYGLAIDCYPLVNGKFYWDAGDAPASARPAFHAGQAAIGAEGERLGLTWGGRWSSPYDPPHLQLLGQKELPPAACLEIYKANGGNLQAVWDEATRRVHQGSL